ncbi:MAG: hypothetical protein RLP02_27340 [Coleofasciculus sp. C2-GNP5-27]
MNLSPAYFKWREETLNDNRVKNAPSRGTETNLNQALLNVTPLQFGLDSAISELKRVQRL